MFSSDVSLPTSRVWLTPQRPTHASDPTDPCSLDRSDVQVVSLAPESSSLTHPGNNFVPELKQRMSFSLTASVEASPFTTIKSNQIIKQ